MTCLPAKNPQKLLRDIGLKLADTLPRQQTQPFASCQNLTFRNGFVKRLTARQQEFETVITLLSGYRAGAFLV